MNALYKVNKFMEFSACVKQMLHIFLLPTWDHSKCSK